MLLKKIYIFILFFAASLLLYSKEPPIARHGIIDLRHWDLSNPVELKGEWEFYWKKLYSPLDFEEKELTPDAYINLPQSWTDLNIDGISDTGYATYRLLILINPQQTKRYSILINEILADYNFFLNGRNIINTGKVGKFSYTSIPQVKIVYTSIGEIQNNAIEIVINVSNFVHRDGGLITVPVIGEEESLFRLYLFRVFLDFFMLGAIFIMALYHLGLFILRRKNRAALTFFAFLIVVSIRILVSSNYLYWVFLPNLSWQTVYRLAYLTFYFMVAIFTRFVQVTFNFKKYKGIFIFIYAFAILYALTVILPPIKFTRILIVYQLFTFLVALFIFYILIAALRSRLFGLRIFLFTYVFFVLAGVHDILYSMGIINATVDFAHIGSFILIFGQSITLARIFTKAFKENEQLNIELNYQKEHLEDLVKQRTIELEEKNQELTEQNIYISEQREQLRKQKEMLEFHNKIIQDSIEYASTIQRAILPLSENINKYFNHFILYLPKDIVSGDFYWFNDSNEKYVFFAVGDCTGHGIPAAFLSLIGSYLLYSLIVDKRIEDPAEIIKNIDIAFRTFFKKKQSYMDGMDIILLRFNKENLHNISYASANMDMIIVNKITKEAKRFRGSRFIIGTRPDAEIISFEHNLNDNDVIYLYSDGYKDQNNPNRERFGSTRLMKLLSEIVDKPMDEQRKELLIKLEEFKSNQPQRDDITLIGLYPKY